MSLKTTIEVDVDELRVLNAFRHIRQHRHGELQAAVKNGRCVKLWTTDKWDDSAAPALRETPEPRP